MSDKLKIMQNHLFGEEKPETELYCASIGYPALRTLPNKERRANCHRFKQPEVDEVAFDKLVQAAEESKLIASG